MGNLLPNIIIGIVIIITVIGFNHVRIAFREKKQKYSDSVSSASRSQSELNPQGRKK